jgi:CheY-like chemotaxis protein
MTPAFASAETRSLPGMMTSQNHQPKHHDRRPATILCVDDDPVVLDLQRAVLKLAGFSVKTAGDSREALLEFRRQIPDSVVLDYEMPGTTGAALAAQLRRISPEVPLILNSGWITVPDHELPLFDRILPKGLAAGLLVHVLRELLSISGAGRLSAGADPDQQRPSAAGETGERG